MAYKAAIRFVVAEGEALARALLADLPQRRELNYPNTGPGALDFLKFLEDFVRHVQDELIILEEQSLSASDDVMGVLLGLAKRANFDLKYIIELLEWVSGAATEDLPFAMVPPCERLLRRFHPKACIIFKCTRDYNYELEILPRKSLRGLVPAKLLDKYSWPIIVVRIPTKPIAETLTHSLVSHELGHAIYSSVGPRIEHDQPQEDEILRVAQPFLAQLGVSSAALALPAQLSFDDLLKEEFGKKVVASIGKRISIVVENWIEEFFADSVGCMLLGPAFFCAYASFLVAVMPMDRFSDDHPADRQRITNILASLTSTAGYSQNILTVQVAALMGEWEKAVLEIPRENIVVDTVDGEIFKVANRIVTACLAAVRKAAFEATEEIRYEVSEYSEDVNSFVELLLQYKIPPIEREREGRVMPLSLASILNVGWEALLRQQSIPDAGPQTGRDQSGEFLHRQRVTLNEMIFRSIDLGEIRRQWEEADGDPVDMGVA